MELPGTARAEPTAAERELLVRYCARYTGNPDAAEDLAQQTLLEAWRHERQLRDPRARRAWLFGIARNTCRMWGRTRGRELARLVDAGNHEWGIEQRLTDPFDPSVELEREDLLRLLDRALALLPPETRRALVVRYVEEYPQAEVAARLGLSEGAVEARLRRGRDALRRLLSTDLREEAEAYGLLDGAATEGWSESRLWCQKCGRRRLEVRFQAAPGAVSFRCPGCHPELGVLSSEFRLSNAHFARLIGGLSRPAVVLRRVAEWTHEYYGRGVDGGRVACTHCGRRGLTLRTFAYGTARVDTDGLVGACGSCGEMVSISRGALALATPEGRAFHRTHRRIRALPERELESHGRAAVVTTYEDAVSHRQFSVVSDRDTVRTLSIHAPADPRAAP